jgi:hypothetical protein
MNSIKFKAIVISYGFAFISAITSEYAAGMHSLKSLIFTAAGSTLAPLLRYVTPFDKTLGLKTWHFIQAWRNRKVPKFVVVPVAK